MLEASLYSHRATSSLDLEGSTALNANVLRELNKLDLPDRRVIFLGITPEFDYPNTILQIWNNSAIKIRKNPAEENHFWTRAVRESDLDYVDLYRVFCPEDLRCNLRTKEGWFFTDTDHLSRKGGSMVEALIANELTPENGTVALDLK